MQTWRHTREKYAIGKESFRKQRMKKSMKIKQLNNKASKQQTNAKKLHYHFLCVFKPVKHQNLELRGIYERKQNTQKDEVTEK